MKLISLGLLAICHLGTGLRTASGQQRMLDLDEAIALSLDHSRTLKIADSKIDAATADVRSAKNTRLPDIDISGQYLRLNKPNIDLKFGNNGSLSGASEGNDDATLGFPDVGQAMFGTAAVTLPIFTGGQINNGMASAKFLEKATKLDAQNDRRQIIQNTVAAYYNLYKAQAAVKLVKENLRSSHQRVVDFTNMEANGLVARNDLLKVQLQESNLELALLAAANNEKTSNYNFNLMLGLDEQLSLTLDSASIATPTIAGSLTDWGHTALENRADAKALENRKVAAHYAVMAAKSRYYPTLALSASYVSANVPHALTVTNALNAGIGLSYNLAALYKAGANVRRAKAQEALLSWTQQQLNDDIKIEIHRAYQDFDQSLKKIAVCQKALEQANENYRITKNKYDNNLATTTDLLDADVARLQTRIDYEYARADAIVAYYKLHEQAGMIDGASAHTLQTTTIEQAILSK